MLGIVVYHPIFIWNKKASTHLNQTYKPSQQISCGQKEAASHKVVLNFPNSSTDLFVAVIDLNKDFPSPRPPLIVSLYAQYRIGPVHATLTLELLEYDHVGMMCMLQVHICLNIESMPNKIHVIPGCKKVPYQEQS